jgi:predicted nucleic-acid-binding protein
MIKKNDYYIFVDSNVLVNYFTDQVADVACLQYLFSNKRKENLFTSSLALVQTASILQTGKKNRRKFSKEHTINCLNQILTKFTILDLTLKDIVNSFSARGNDVEDCVQYTISQKAKCFRIVTNNTGHYADFIDIEAINPKNIKLIKKV